MSDSIRVETSPLGGSALSVLAQTGQLPEAWCPGRPRNAEQWRRRVELVRSTMRGGWSEALIDAMAVTPGSPAAERLAAVAERGGVVVTTGQQPGLFGGPVYTWSKALSALALADALEAESGVPVAPVFWAATDDSDFAEASWTFVGGPEGAERLVLDGAPADGVRMADVPLVDMTRLLERLAAACGSSADPRPLAITQQAWTTGRTIGQAYVDQLRGLLEPLGIAVLDASHPAVGQAAHPILLRALHERERVRRLLAERGEAIRAAGHQPQVHEMEDLTLVFERADGRRVRVARARGAVAAAVAQRGSLSPNVLLRPVVERALLPTVAYLAGPGELAYYAQVSAVASALEADQPLAVPRWSAFLLEPHVSRILARHGLSASELSDPHAAETRLATTAWPVGVAKAMGELRDRMAGALGSVREAVGAEDGLLPPTVIEGVARTMSWRIGRLERRINAAVKQREAGLMRDLRIARGSLFPGGERQERALNLVPLLARYGPPLLDAMRAAAGAHARALLGTRSASGAMP